MLSSKCGAAYARQRVVPTPPPQAAVINVNVIPAARAATTLRALFPRARIRVDAHANAVVVVASPDDVQQMRTVVQGIDVRNPQTPTTEVLQLRILKPLAIVPRLRTLYPNAHVEAASKTTLLVRATTQDMVDIRSVISSLDVAPPAAAPSTAPADAVRVTQARPREVARALERQLPHLRASVMGSTIILVGSQEDIAQAKTLVQQIDVPAFGSRYTQVYRLHNIDASSVADLIRRSYPNITVTVDKDLNAISVFADAGAQQRIALAVNELDSTQQSAQSGTGAPAYSDANVAVVDLQSAMPGQNGTASDTAQNIAQSVTQALQSLASDVRVTAVPNEPQIILSGSPQSIRVAKDLISRLDQPRPLVVLDTEVLQVNETASRNLGLQLPGAYLQTAFQEVDKNGNPYGYGSVVPTMGLQKIGRYGLSLTAVLNFLVQQGTARVLADPRIATISGHTAHIQAGDQINIVTTTGGGIGTPVTQQLQQFTTGVTLDITPVVSSNGMVDVALHPQVNSLSGFSQDGLPEIATRDTSTVVQLHDDQTLVIGGLIQETDTHTVSKLPLLGDIPLVGRLFRNSDTEHQRNELVIVVTPHIIKPGAATPSPNVPQAAPAAVLPIPTPAALPTLRPGTELPKAELPPPRAEPSPVGVVPVPPAPQATPNAIPAPTPTAFANTNVFTFGSPPSNTYAAATQTPQIFYAQFSPTVLKNGTNVEVFAVTTTNVARVVIGYQGYWTALTQTAPSRWQASFPIDTLGLTRMQSPVNLQLNAYRTDGASASVQIPVSLLGQ